MAKGGDMARPRFMASAVSPPFLSIFNLAEKVSLATGTEEDLLLFSRLFRVSYGHAKCIPGDDLALKYSMQIMGGQGINRQTIVSVTNRFEGQMTWFNAERTRKPQTFVQKQASVGDTTENRSGSKCDFCQWEALTARDVFGRIELKHAVSASNLFKYGCPFHGLVIFKHHDPLTFNLDQLQDMMTVSAQWFNKARQQAESQEGVAESQEGVAESQEGVAESQEGVASSPLHTFFIWNCLARAGASQYHGHAQLLLTSDPLPVHTRIDEASREYEAAHPCQSYVDDLVRSQVGLASSISSEKGSGGLNPSWILASPCPIKDMELIITGTNSLDDPSFVLALYTSLRTLIDDLGIESFNVGITGHGDQSQGVMARVLSRGKVNQVASDFGALEVIGGASIGHTDPYHVIGAVKRRQSSLSNS